MELGSTYYDVHFLDASTGWLVTGSEIAHTMDSGLTWDIQHVSPDSRFSTIYFADRHEGWVLDESGNILHTSDSGQTWVVQELPPGYSSPEFKNFTPELRSMCYGGPHTLWVVGEYGTVLKYTDPDLYLTPPSYWSVEPSGKDIVSWGGVKGQGQSSGTQLPMPANGLLQNYPNPFNPETWIPYQLAQDGEVTISIYNVGGQLMRTLSLGKKRAGLYLDKRQAAQWDGLDSIGQSVASGLYFYTIAAGDYTATRKMIILP